MSCNESMRWPFKMREVVTLHADVMNLKQIKYQGVIWGADEALHTELKLR